MTTSRKASLEGGNGAWRRWIEPIVLLLLVIWTVNLVSRTSQPFMVTFTDLALLVILAVVTGIYIISLVKN